VKIFNISRINTPLGIFRLRGSWCNDNLNLDIDTIELMGTDGWVLLNHSRVKVIQLIDELTPMLVVHLLAKIS